MVRESERVFHKLHDQLLVYYIYIYIHRYTQIYNTPFVGVAVMLIQHYVPPSVDNVDCPECRLYFANILVWICGSFALAGLLSVISLIQTEIGRRRNARTHPAVVEE